MDLLLRGDNDAALILGADPGATMPQPAIDHLARIPTIVLDPKVTHTSRLSRVHITTAATGISAPGTVYRMDEIPLPLRPRSEIAVSDGRGSGPPDLQGRGRQAAPDPAREAGSDDQLDERSLRNPSPWAAGNLPGRWVRRRLVQTQEREQVGNSRGLNRLCASHQ